MVIEPKIQGNLPAGRRPPNVGERTSDSEDARDCHLRVVIVATADVTNQSLNLPSARWPHSNLAAKSAIDMLARHREWSKVQA